MAVVVKLLCQWSQNKMTNWSHFFLVYQFLNGRNGTCTSLIPTLCIVHSRSSINNSWKQGEGKEGWKEKKDGTNGAQG